MIEMVILAMIASIVVKRGAEDLIHSARGGTPPRYAAASARKKSGAAGRYWGSVWDDVWTDALKRRSEKRADPSRPRGAATVFWSNLWRDGWVGLERKRQGKATRPRTGTTTVPGEVVPDFEDEDGPQDEDDFEALDCDENFEDVERQPSPFAPTQDGDGPTIPADANIPCPRDGCGGTLVPTGRFHFDEGDGGAIADLECDRDCGISSAHYWTPTEAEYEEYFGHSFDDDEDPSTATPHQEGTTMTATTIEVVGLADAIRYCEDSSRAYKEMVFSIERTRAAISEGDVSGPAADALDHAMEMSAAASAAMTTAADEFKKHLVVAEAYDATPGAGTREFVTGGR